VEAGRVAGDTRRVEREGQHAEARARGETSHSFGVPCHRMPLAFKVRITHGIHVRRFGLRVGRDLDGRPQRLRAVRGRRRDALLYHKQFQSGPGMRCKDYYQAQNCFDYLLLSNDPEQTLDELRLTSSVTPR
jgi:hypothetical protein